LASPPKTLLSWMKVLETLPRMSRSIPQDRTTAEAAKDERPLGTGTKLGEVYAEPHRHTNSCLVRYRKQVGNTKLRGHNGEFESILTAPMTSEWKSWDLTQRRHELWQRNGATTVWGRANLMVGIL
jgi:hypothetical protein